ncbi:MAG: rubrerythrin family protein [Dehalococcoidia bacterium]|nr:rubrerythrin family protein [Dehalococcoidia bacterium]
MTTTTADEIQRYRRYLQGEVDGVFIYHTLAEIEASNPLGAVYERLAAVEERHLKLWRDQLSAAGAEEGSEGPTLRVRLLMWLARQFGPDLVLPVLKSMESDASTMYVGEPVAEAAGLPADEQSHYRAFDLIGGRRAGVAGSVIGRIESRHRSLGSGNALRASVLGANDGLVSNFALVMGFAGAATGQATVVLAGVAGLLAGACSMALGEWVSVTSAREAAEAQIAIEREEIEREPESEREELMLIYLAKGLPAAEAEALASRIMSDPDTALSTLAREELGLAPEDLGSPWTAASASFVLFAVGAILPVVPFFFGAGAAAIAGSALLSALGLFGVGSGITLLTGRSVRFSGLRQVVLGVAAAAVTFGIGTVVGNLTGI